MPLRLAPVSRHDARAEALNPARSPLFKIRAMSTPITPPPRPMPPLVDPTSDAVSTTLSWGVAALWEQLAPLLPGLSIEVLRSVGSTNSVLLDRASVRPGERRGNAAEVAKAADIGSAQVRRSVESAAFGRRAADLQPGLLVAEQQSAGRGRQGRVWQSVAGASLTFSLGVPLALRDWSGLSLAVGVALCEALDPLGAGASPRLALKWPNDLWLVDVAAAAGADASANVSSDGASRSPARKLGGILIETVAAGPQRLAVIGIGLNVLAWGSTPAGAGLSSGFGAVCELDPAATAPTVLARVALPLVLALQQFERDGFGAFAQRFAARDLLFRRAVTTTRADLPHGIARGVSAQGELRVEAPGGAIVNVASGEVSVRLDGPPPQAALPC